MNKKHKLQGLIVHIAYLPVEYDATALLLNLRLAPPRAKALVTRVYTASRQNLSRNLVVCKLLILTGDYKGKKGYSIYNGSEIERQSVNSTNSTHPLHWYENIPQQYKDIVEGYPSE
jgi:hypothetical protein